MGASWTKLIANGLAPFSGEFVCCVVDDGGLFAARYAPNLALLGGTIFMVGGAQYFANVVSDCWSTPDGVTWTQKSSSISSYAVCAQLLLYLLSCLLTHTQQFSNSRMVIAYTGMLRFMAVQGSGIDMYSSSDGSTLITFA